MKYYIVIVSLALIFTFPELAQAYIGPGLGAGTIAIVLGFLGSIFLALFAVLWYPLKRIIKKIKGKKREDN